jgi:hypothetical protein
MGSGRATTLAHVVISYGGVCASAAGTATSDIAKADIRNKAIAVVTLIFDNCIFSFFPVFLIHFRVQCVISIKVVYKILQFIGKFLFNFVLYTDFVILDKMQDKQ